MGQLDEVSHKIGGLEARLDVHMKSSSDFQNEILKRFDKLEEGVLKKVDVLEAESNKRKGALVVIGAVVSICVTGFFKLMEAILK